MAADDVTDFSVYYFNEGLRGAPQLSGTSGALIAVLDACLITGFGTVSVTSLTVADGVATAARQSHAAVVIASVTIKYAAWPRLALRLSAAKAATVRRCVIRVMGAVERIGCLRNACL